MQSAVISTGDWLNVGLIIFFGLFAVVEAMVAWKMWRRPATTIRPGFWTAERHSGEGSASLFLVRGPVTFSPVGTSFEIVDAKCEVRGAGVRARLMRVSPELNELHQGGKTLAFTFREAGDSSAFPRPGTKSLDIEVWIKLADGSKFHETQRDVAIGPSVVHIRGSSEPNRTPPQMARRGFFQVRAWLARAWRESIIMRIWNNLKHG